MPVAWFCKLYGRIPSIEAKRQVSWLNTIAYPYLDDRARNSVLRHLIQTARGRSQTTLVAPPSNGGTPDSFSHGWAALRRLRNDISSKRL